MKLYLAGPMRGKPFFNFPAFGEARNSLRSYGHEVACPAERDEIDGFVPDPNGVNLEGWDARESFSWDLEKVLWCDGVAVLPGWESSSGCAIEISVAQLIGTPVYSVHELLDAASSVREPKPMRFGGDSNYLRVLREMTWLHQRKGADYGTTGDAFANVRASSSWGVKSWVGAMIRANDKVVRLQAAARGSALQNEGVEDSLIDLAAYAIIALVLYRQDMAKAPAQEAA